MEETPFCGSEYPLPAARPCGGCRARRGRTACQGAGACAGGPDARVVAGRKMLGNRRGAWNRPMQGWRASRPALCYHSAAIVTSGRATEPRCQGSARAAGRKTLGNRPMQGWRASRPALCYHSAAIVTSGRATEPRCQGSARAAGRKTLGSRPMQGWRASRSALCRYSGAIVTSGRAAEGNVRAAGGKRAGNQCMAREIDSGEGRGGPARRFGGIVRDHARKTCVRARPLGAAP